MGDYGGFAASSQPNQKTKKPKPGTNPEQDGNSRADQAAIGLFSGLGGLGAASAAALGGDVISDKFPGSKFEKEVRSVNYKELLPGLDKEFYQRPGLSSLRGVTSDGDYRFGQLTRFNSRLRFDVQPQDVFDEVFGKQDDFPVPSVDWGKTSQSFWTNQTRKSVKDSLTSYDIPIFGQDLGGFARRTPSTASESLTRVLTATPQTNSSRFAHRDLPELVNTVYGKLARSQEIKDAIDNASAIGDNSVASAGKIPDHYKKNSTVGSRQEMFQNWRQKELSDQIALMDTMSPGQSRGTGVSATVWGTLDSTPRYEYTDIRNGTIRSGNPEIHVMDVDTPSAYQTKYLYTPDTRSPFVNRFSDTPGEYNVGPHWGMVEQMGPLSTSGRRKSDVTGDISFNSGLIKKRGALSFADIQAVQQANGIPITIDPGERGRGFRDAVESVRKKLELNTHREVIERFARNVPVLGQTTAPRQPARVISTSPADPDLAIRPTSSLKRAYDLPAALKAAGVPATIGGIRAVNKEVDQRAAQALARVERTARFVPLAGNISGAVMDPDAARLVAQGLASGGPSGVSKVLQGGQTMVTNSLIGTAIGGGLKEGFKMLTRRAPAIAASVLPKVAAGLEAVTPAGLALSAYQTADAAVEGLTGRSMTRHAADAFRGSPAGQALRTAVGGRQASEVLPQLFPGRPSGAVTSQTGKLTQTNPSRVGDRGANNKVFAGQGYGWQSQVSYNKLQSQGKLRPRTRPEQFLTKAYKAVDRFAGGLLPGGVARR